MENFRILKGDDSGEEIAKLHVDYLSQMNSGTGNNATVTHYLTNSGTTPAGVDQIQQNDDSVISGDASGILNVGTSMGWNVEQLKATGDITADDLNNLTGYLLDSPAADANYSITDPDSDVADWIFEVAYEFEFASDLFLAADWTDPAKAMIGDQLQYVDLGTAHASPEKVAVTGMTGFTCIEGCGPPAPVPLPAAAWLFGSALMGLLAVSRRKLIGKES